MNVIRVLIALLLIIPSSGFSQTNFPGGVAEIYLAKQSNELPEVKYGLRDPVIIETPDQWRVLVGISLDTLPGDYLLYLKRTTPDSTGEHRKITVEHRDYPLTDTERRISERNVKSALVRDRTNLSQIDFSNTQQPDLPLQLPVKGQWSDTFGHQFFDSAENKLLAQNAVSLTTTELAVVTSPQNAIVSRVDTDSNNTSTVYLDHGRGLYSIIEGVSDVTVEAGNGVVAGAMIGRLANESGAKTGHPATLIWQVSMNQVFVNPLILTQLTP